MRARHLPGTRPRPWRHQRGVALITVLLVFAVVAVITVEMLRRSQLNLRSVGNLIDARQAWYYALGGEALARQLLAQDARTAKEKDSLDEAWARVGEEPPFAIEQGGIRVAIHDLQGRFNLNSVVTAQGQPASGDALARLRLLLEEIGVDTKYADLWRDWVDADQAVLGNGAEDAAYSGYETAGKPETDISALRLLHGMTPDDFALIEPHVATLPPDDKININTAGETVLAALGPAVRARSATIRARQQQGGYDARALESLLEGAQDAGAVAVRSSYFEVITTVRYLEQTLRLRSVLKRDQNSGAMTVLSRTRLPFFDNTDSESLPP